MVQLKDAIDAPINDNQIRFNSSMVQLKGVNGYLGEVDLHRFNSSMVQLKGIPAGQPRGEIIRFNSSMVQLKGGRLFAAAAVFPFQFLDGTIKRNIATMSSLSVPGFNSSMVQLKVEPGKDTH